MIGAERWDGWAWECVDAWPTNLDSYWDWKAHRTPSLIDNVRILDAIAYADAGGEA